eukprot:TRINITY_DN37832_c0_g1_i1.p1 TRINITY_DN37832_c0_g1~~TRINITY_DN37832_c0_g1_i1.p1  ORF type:complete len:407 (+),score=135.51 TRINITY_DN37832_c0_g1_i1:63-1223(+)
MARGAGAVCPCCGEHAALRLAAAAAACRAAPGGVPAAGPPRSGAPGALPPRRADDLPTVCLLLLAGPPGAGKSTVLRLLQEEAGGALFIPVRFDDVHGWLERERGAAEFDPALWHEAQAVWRDAVGALLRAAGGAAAGGGAELHERWLTSLLGDGPLPRSSAARAVVVVAEDTCHYSSMRQPLRRTAAHAAAAFCTGWLCCPVDLCLARNASRPAADRVPPEVVRHIAAAAEPPGRPWEEPWAVVDTAEANPAEAAVLLRELAAEALRRPPPPLPDPDAEQARVRAAQLATERSVAHRLDQQLRKATAALMPTCVAALGAEGRRRLSAAVAKLRADSLARAKREAALALSHCATGDDDALAGALCAAATELFTAAALRLAARLSQE